MNLMYCGDYYSFDGILMSFLSIEKYHNDIDVYILTADFTSINEKFKPINSEQIDNLSSLNKDIKIHLIDCTTIFNELLENSKNINSKYTPYSLLRLLITKLNLDIDKILYLDTDIVALEPLTDLYQLDISNYEIAMVKDHMGKIFIGPKYCNSGVMLININECNKTKLFDKCIECINTKDLSFPDQDAINKCINKKLIIPKKYNEQRKIKKDTTLKHFCKGIRWLPFKIYNVKPWNIEEFRKFYKTNLLDDLIDKYQKLKKKWSK